MVSLIGLADKLFSKYARISRSDEKGSVLCICCGGSDHWSVMDAAHFIGRANMAFRYSIENVYPCHRDCHSAPDHMDKYKASLIKKNGEAFVDDLIFRSKQYNKAPDELELLEIIDDLTVKLNAYANSKSEGGQSVS
jgi:Bacteriophage Lambda NinG protein